MLVQVCSTETYRQLWQSRPANSSMPPCIQGFGMIGVETDHCCEVLNCVVLLSQLLECGAPLKEGFGIFGLQCNYLRVVPNSTFI